MGVFNTGCIAKHLRFLLCLIWQLLTGLSHAVGWPVSKPWKLTVRIGLQGHACGIASWSSMHGICTHMYKREKDGFVDCRPRQHIQIYSARLMNPSMWTDNHGHRNHWTLFPSVHLQVFFMVVVGQWRNTTPFDNTYVHIYVCRFKLLSSNTGASLFLSYEN